MKTRCATLAAFVAALGFAGAANAGSITIDAQGGSVGLVSGPMDDLFSDAGEHLFESGSLADVHESLHEAGLSTDGMVSFLLVDTAEGLGFLALVDDPTAGGDTQSVTTLGLTSSAPSSAGWWISPDAQSTVSVFDPFGISTSAAGSFSWLDEGSGEALAWTNLAPGDTVAFNFTLLGGSGLDESAFQFLSWNGDDWEQIEVSSFTSGCQFAFTFTVVPLPAPLLMGLVGLTGVAVLRRRRLH